VKNNSLHAGAVGSPAIFGSSALTNRKQKHRGQHKVKVPCVRTITDIKGSSPRKRRNGRKPVGYLGRVALRREQYEKMTVRII
jgi:hypothetical protein